VLPWPKKIKKGKQNISMLDFKQTNLELGSSCSLYFNNFEEHFSEENMSKP
jgi:hypothetical protein